MIIKKVKNKKRMQNNLSLFFLAELLLFTEKITRENELRQNK
jgi:hypothetical protein